MLNVDKVISYSCVDKLCFFVCVFFLTYSEKEKELEQT